MCPFRFVEQNNSTIRWTFLTIELLFKHLFLDSDVKLENVESLTCRTGWKTSRLFASQLRYPSPLPRSAEKWRPRLFEGSNSLHSWCSDRLGNLILLLRFGPAVSWLRDPHHWPVADVPKKRKRGSNSRRRVQSYSPVPVHRPVIAPNSVDVGRVEIVGPLRICTTPVN